jgi:CubicO group peptidase (beta-lactamase class C family)
LEFSSTYFPAKDKWEKKEPESLGMNPDILENAVSIAINDSVADYPEGVDIHEFKAHKLQSYTKGNDDGKIIGPLKRKGSVNGLVIRNGYIVAQFGDTSQIDEIASASKSFIATIAGLAKDDGLINDFNSPVRDLITDWKFESAHNSKITWHQLLQQTSEWEGTLWGKSDKTCRSEGADRKLNEPGTFWEYNDVRINCLALCLLQLFKEPLPDILKKRIMALIGASDTWEWHGYTNSDIEINGRNLKSVTGGAHWGGGIWMNSFDFARFGYLHLRKGNWDGVQLFDHGWTDRITNPCRVMEKPIYGYLWWIQPDNDNTMLSYGAEGGGYHICRIFPKYDMVTVVRWTGWDGFWKFNKKVVESII